MKKNTSLRKSPRFCSDPVAPESKFKAKSQTQPAKFVCHASTPIKDLCLNLLHLPSSQCLGYMKSQEWHYHIHEARLVQLNGDLASIRDVLHGRNRAGSFTRERYAQIPVIQRLYIEKLKIFHRCKCSLFLAMAVLQLYDTGWLDQTWSLDQVYYDSNVASGQLYISRCFHAGATPDIDPRQKSCLIKNEWLFSLGVALLELSQGKPLEHFQVDDDLDPNRQPHPLTRYLIADRLTREIKDHETSNFAKAVGKCIHPASDTYDFQLSNDGFRQKFYEDVVLPLQMDYDYVTH